MDVGQCFCDLVQVTFGVEQIGQLQVLVDQVGQAFFGARRSVASRAMVRYLPSHVATPERQTDLTPAVCQTAWKQGRWPSCQACQRGAI